MYIVYSPESSHKSGQLEELEHDVKNFRDRFLGFQPWGWGAANGALVHFHAPHFKSCLEVFSAHGRGGGQPWPGQFEDKGRLEPLKAVVAKSPPDNVDADWKQPGLTH